MPPLLSIVVPAYGVGEYLPACLDSLLSQTLEDIEVIIVDDGSPDESGEIADDYASIDSRVRVLHTENQGVGAARNEGVRAVTGRYIAFADPDDLVPPRAYELLVESLERTGSDIAAGNAWRYIEGKGNVQSWTHAEAFAETRLKTHIREFPALIRDRMLWNKVYRRSFWDEYGFEFPHMRYEDYPVAMLAHIKASSVDVYSDKVYHWRQRVAEDSITQRSLELDNISDRVVSAEMVLDYANPEGGEIVERIHSYFTDIDIVTLATALAEGSEEEHAEIGALAVRLARRLQPVRRWTTPLARSIHAALVRGDLEGAAVLAARRRKGSREEVLRAFLKPKRIVHLPKLVADFIVGDSALPRIKGRNLRSRVMEVTRVEDSTMVQVETKLRRALLERATITAELRSSGSVISLDANVAALNGQRATTEIPIPDALVEQLGEVPHELMVRVAVGPMTWEGPVNIGRGQIPDPFEMRSGAWVVASRWEPRSYSLWIRRAEQSTIADVEITQDELVLRVDPGFSFAAILRPDPSDPLISRVENGVALFSLKDVIDDPADDPVTGRAYRDIVALSAAAKERVAADSSSTVSLVSAATGSDDAVTPGQLETDVVPSGVDAGLGVVEDRHANPADAHGELDRAGVTPLLLASVPGDETIYGDHAVRICRSVTGSAEIQHTQLH